MATNHTTNYNLNLWEANDKFVREEFNENTSKIDAAIKAVDTKADAISAAKASTADLNTQAARITALENKSRFTLIRSGNFASSMTIDLSSINWAEWDKVHIDMVTTNGGQGTIHFNSQNSTIVFYLRGGNTGDTYHPRMTFYPGYHADRRITATFGEQVVSQQERGTYSTLNCLSFTSGFDSTATYSIWGEK